jgi:hypothetical protein
MIRRGSYVRRERKDWSQNLPRDADGDTFRRMVRDAETADEARALLAAGQGHRCHLGDCLHMELQELKDGA